MNEELVGLIATACRVLGKLEATHSTFGHVSARDGSDAMLIRGKGPAETGLRYTDDSDIVRVGFDAETLEGPEGLRSPSESYLHAWLYRLRPEVQSVIHMHPESAVLLTMCGYQLRPIYGAYGRGAALAVEGVPVYDMSLTISNHERGKHFAEFMGSARAALLRGHGVAVVGTSVEDATVTTMLLKELTDMTYRALLIGEPKVLPADESVEVGETPKLADRPRGSAGGYAGVLAMWRYYKALSDEHVPGS